MNNKHEKIINSIGMLDDEALKAALEYRPASNKREITYLDKKPAVSFRRIMAIGLAATLTIALALTCVVNAEEISSLFKSVFQREQELIDPYAVQPDNEIDESEISMTIDKVFLDGGNYYFYVNFHNPDGFDSDLFCFEKMTLYRLNDNDVEKKSVITAVVTENGANEHLVFAGRTISGKMISDTDFEAIIIISGHETPEQAQLSEGKYSFDVEGLTGAYISDYNDYKMVSYAEQLHADFQVDEEGLLSLPNKTLELNEEFEIEGYKFVLEKIIISPISVELVVTDRLHQVIEIGSEQFSAINLLSYFTNVYSAPFDDSDDRSIAIRDYLSDHNAYEKIYNPAIELTDNAKKYWNDHITQYKPIDYEEGGYSYTVCIRTLFDAPIYEDEILSISFGNSEKANSKKAIVWKNNLK